MAVTSPVRAYSPGPAPQHVRRHTPRTVRLPAIDRVVPIGAYMAAVARAKANPDATFKNSFETWWPVKGSEIVEQFVNGLQDRINRHIPNHGKGRKWSSDWEADARRTAHAVNNRIVIRWVPRDLRGRLEHRITKADD